MEVLLLEELANYFEGGTRKLSFTPERNKETITPVITTKFIYSL